MRENFTWQDRLPDEIFDRVLLLLGLLPPRLARLRSLPHDDELSRLLVNRWEALRGRPWPWRLRQETARLIEYPDDAIRLVKATSELLDRTRSDWRSINGRGLRIEVNVPRTFDSHPLYEALLRGGASSAYVRRSDEGDLDWSWPIRVGVLAGSELLRVAARDSSLRPLFREFEYEHAPMRANLLIFESSVSDVIQTIARRQHATTTDAVLIFGGFGANEGNLDETLTRLSRLTSAEGIFVFDSLERSKAEFETVSLIANLSHNLPLDSAVARIALYRRIPMFAWATRSLVNATSLREQGRALVRRLQQMPNARIRLDADTARILRGDEQTGPSRTIPGPPVFGTETPAATLVRARDLGGAIRKRIQPPVAAESAGAEPEPLRFDRETEGARALASLVEAVAPVADTETALQETRYLQARVETTGGRPINGEAPLRHFREYLACVFIGSRDPSWLGLETPLEAPIPPDGSALVLDVLFWEPQASPKPQTKQLSLRPRGDTDIVTFSFRTAETQSLLSARIAIYHRNRILQTGLLRGRVGNEPARLTFVPDATPLPKFVGLADRAGVGASIIVNDDPSGRMQAFVYRDGVASVADVSDTPTPLAVNVDPTQQGGLAALTAALGRAITRITTNPEEYDSLAKEGTRTLLLQLALHGGGLLNRLRKHSQMGEQFDDVGYIQIVTAHVDAFFPIEYFYDGEVPEDDAQICNGAQAAVDALREGKCCGAYAQNPQHTICPLRFWSLTKVIERHAHLPEHLALNGQFQLRSAGVSARDRLLDPLRCAVLAASQEADTAVPDTVKNLRTNLDSVLRTNPVAFATDWANWATCIANTRPNLLILLPHHAQEDGFDLLEIGGDKRKSMQIRNEHVRAPQDSTTRPIVLLIGCQTNSAKIDLEGFAPAFQDAKAAIIVTTIASILGRSAGPAAAAIVQELKNHESNPNATFGEVMLAVRRKLLAEGTPMILGLTSYGDADWRIGTSDGGDS